MKDEFGNQVGTPDAEVIEFEVDGVTHVRRLYRGKVVKMTSHVCFEEDLGINGHKEDDEEV